MSFAVIVSFVFVNLFVTVILETFEVATKNAAETKVQAEESTQKQGMNPSEYSFFCALWNKYDLNARMMLPEDIFLDFVCELDPPMGFGLNRRLASEKLIKERLMILACMPEEVEVGDGNGDNGTSTQSVYVFDMAVQATAQLMILHQTDPGLIAKLDKLDPHMKKKAKSFSRKLHERKSRYGEKELEVVKEVVSLSKVSRAKQAKSAQAAKKFIEQMKGKDMRSKAARAKRRRASTMKSGAGDHGRTDEELAAEDTIFRFMSQLRSRARNGGGR